MLTALSLCPSSKHALGSHEYIQYCRKFGVDIRLQLMEQKTVRGDLARTVRVRRGGWPAWGHGARCVGLGQERGAAVEAAPLSEQGAPHTGER